MNEPKYEKKIDAVNQAGMYQTYGNAALRPEPKQAPVTQPVKKPQTHQKPLTRQKTISAQVAVAAIVTIVVGLAVALTLAFAQIAVTKINAQNTQLNSSIQILKKDIGELNSEINESISIDEVYEFIEENGLVRINPAKSNVTLP